MRVPAPQGRDRGWTPVATAASSSHRRPERSLPGRLVVYLTAVTLTAAVLAVVGLASTPLRTRDLATWAAFLACAAVSVEAARRDGEPAGASKDLLSAWTLPIAMLLPPVYALLAPVPLTALTQLRVRRSALHRRVFSAAAIGLEGFVRSVVFHALLGPLDSAAGDVDRAALAALAGIGCGLVVAQLNTLLVAVAVRSATPEVRWRQLVGRREDVVLDAGELCMGVLIAVAWTVTPLMALVALTPMILLHRSLAHAQLRAAVRTDCKTGLLNPAGWQQEAEQEVARAARTGSPLAVMIADLDHFKRVNDEHGHLTGDRLLVAAAEALRGSLRRYDLLGRFGGEEFTVLLPNTELAEARQIATRLRQQVAVTAVTDDDGVEVRVTVSIGAAVRTADGTDLTDLLAAADHALYAAKTAGRDRVAFAADAVTVPAAPATGAALAAPVSLPAVPAPARRTQPAVVPAGARPALWRRCI